MAYTITDLQNLQNALAAGVTRVTYNGRSVDYQSIDNLIKAIEYVQGEINAANGVVNNRQVRISSNKGLGHNGILWPGGFY